MPRVVIAHDYLTQRGGAERVVLAMLEAFPGARVVTTFHDPASTFPEFADHEVETTWPNRFRVLRDDPRRAFPILAPTVARHRITDADVVLASSSGWAHGFATDVPKVVYCHNPARWLHQRSDYAAGIPAPARVALDLLAPSLVRWDRRAATGATSYVANSTAVQQRIKRAYGIDADLLHPPPGLDPEGPQSPVPGLRPGFLLTIARARGYKNSQVLCEAAAHLPEHQLAVVGGLPESTHRPANVVDLGRVDDARLRWLYANAAGLVAVSHEDFGLTPVEGYGFGLPSVLLRAGGYLDSSVEDLTTVFVDEVSPSAVAAGVRELLARGWDRELIRKHADQFSPATFRQRLRDAVSRAVHQEPSSGRKPR